MYYQYYVVLVLRGVSTTWYYKQHVYKTSTKQTLCIVMAERCSTKLCKATSRREELSCDITRHWSRPLAPNLLSDFIRGLFCCCSYLPNIAAHLVYYFARGFDEPAKATWQSAVVMSMKPSQGYMTVHMCVLCISCGLHSC